MGMADSKDPIQSVQTFGRKKTATAVAYCKRGKGLIRVNGKPLTEVEPKALQHKLLEPVLLLGQDRFADVDVRIRVKGGGRIAQVYAIRQALSIHSSHTTRNTLTNRARRRSRTPWFSTTAACLWPTRGVASPRSSVGPEPVPDTRSHTVKNFVVCILVYCSFCA